MALHPEKDAINETIHQFENYLWLMDTSSLLLHPAIDSFFTVFQTINHDLYIPLSCYIELKTMAGNPLDETLQNQAKETIALIQKISHETHRIKLQQNNVLFEDIDLNTYIQSLSSTQNVLFMTQNSEFAKTIKVNNNQSKYKVDVRQLLNNGHLALFAWQIVGLPPVPKVPAQRTDNIETEKETIQPQKNVAYKAPFKEDVESLKETVPEEIQEQIQAPTVQHGDDAVHDDDSNIYYLQEEMTSNDEATLYSLNSKQCVKIFKKDCSDLQERIDDLIQKDLDREGIYFPKKCVYDKDNQFAGYIMEKPNGKPLGQIISDNELPAKNKIEICIDLLDKVKFLHAHNILIGNVNMKNIWVDFNYELYFLDTEAYQFDSYPALNRTSGFIPPELIGKDLSNTMRTKENESFSIAVLLFMILFRCSPYTSTLYETDEDVLKGDFRYNLESIDYSNPSIELLKAFYSTFEKEGDHYLEKQRYSIANWRNLFAHYRYLLKENEDSSFDSFQFRPTPVSNQAKIPAAQKPIENQTESENMKPCRICGKMINAQNLYAGICNDCLDKSIPGIKCRSCGKEIKGYTYRNKYIDRIRQPRLCDECKTDDGTVIF